MIKIGVPYIYTDGKRAYLKAPIVISEDTSKTYMNIKKYMRKVHWRVDENYPPKEWRQDDFGLWFSVDAKYKEFLHSETADAFVVAMLWYGMTTGSDIISEAPVSEQLLFRVNNLLIPALCTEKNNYRRIIIEAPTVNTIYNKSLGVGTGMSCGIDSLYTLWKYSNIEMSDKKLTHLTYFNMGAIFHPDSSSKTKYSLREFYKKTDEMSEEKIKNAEEVANKVSLPLISVHSNIDSDIYRGAYGYTAVYRNCACALALQKLFSTYYCSSAGWPDYFDLNLSEGSEHYESLLCSCFSTESLSFEMSDYVTRIEKTVALGNYPLAWNYLDVCFNFHNCGSCPKCFRTLITLEIIGALDNFNRVFDVDSYRKNRAKAYGWLLYGRLGDERDDNAVFARDIYRLAKEKHIKIPACSRVYMIKNAAVGFLVKLKHRLFPS